MKYFLHLFLLRTSYIWIYVYIWIPGIYQENTEKLLESILFCLQISVENNERNKRKLLLTGLDILMDIEECIISIPQESIEYRWIKSGIKNDNVQLISKNLIDLIGEFNYIVCSHCFVKQAIKVACVYIYIYIYILQVYIYIYIYFKYIYINIYF
jgi:hypothetical protein